MSTTVQEAPVRQASDLKHRSVAFFGEFSFWPSYHGGPPEEVARRLGAHVRTKVDDDLDYLILGDRRGTGRAEARKKAEQIQRRAQQKAKKTGEEVPCLEVLTEADFREMVKVDVTGKRFAFFGGFDSCPSGFDEKLLTQMVQRVGGTVQTEVDDGLDYLILGNRRGPGKVPAKSKAEKLREAGSPLVILDENAFLELVHVESTEGQTLDFAGFMAHLHNISEEFDRRKLKRAVDMLKAESFQLYVKLSEDRLVGVVRSQTGVGSVYAPWLTAEGKYGCSTPELADCMGLQGSYCKHLLVLVVGLVRAGEMDPERACAWITQASGKRPKTNKDLAAETFLQYKGAQAGEIDWRPTETIPEDFYAL